MRAVNLVPPEARAGRVSPGKSGGAVYGVIGALVVALLMLSSLALVKKQKAAADQELVAVQQSTAAYEQVATRFAAFEKASKDANDRITLVRNLSQARFDWAGTLRDLARLIPAQTQIQQLDASVKDGAPGAAGGSSFRSQLADVPAITLKGCTKSQSTVADLVTRLQAMRRVTNVTLEQSGTDASLIGELDKSVKDLGDIGAKKEEDTGGSAVSGADCSLPKPFYTFTVTVFYAAGKAQSSAEMTPATGTATAASGIATESAGATTPATSTPAGN
jgi:Tfp pilus assembly protein PilN